MDYAKIYSNFIAQCRSQSLSGYSEQHHIIPVSLGGDNNPDNLIRLTVRQHCFAHKLLYKIFGSTQIFSIMCFYRDANPNRFEFRKKHRVAKWVRRADKREMHRAKNRHRLKKKQLAKKVAKRTDNVV